MDNHDDYDDDVLQDDVSIPCRFRALFSRVNRVTATGDLWVNMPQSQTIEWITKGYSPTKKRTKT